MESKKFKGKIVFDVDGTLITYKDEPNYKVIELYHWFQSMGWKMYIHSGGGIDYAQRWAEKLGLEPCKIAEKGNPIFEYTIAVDDCLDEYDWTSKKHKNYINAKTFIIV